MYISVCWPTLQITYEHFCDAHPVGPLSEKVVRKLGRQFLLWLMRKFTAVFIFIFYFRFEQRSEMWYLTSVLFILGVILIPSHYGLKTMVNFLLLQMADFSMWLSCLDEFSESNVGRENVIMSMCRRLSWQMTSAPTTHSVSQSHF